MKKKEKTILDKVLEENPDTCEEDITLGCPSEYGYPEYDNFCTERKLECLDCWAQKWEDDNE